MKMHTKIITFCLTSAALLTGCGALQPGVETPTPAVTPTVQVTATTAAPALATKPPATSTVPAGAQTVAPITPSVSSSAAPTSVRPTVVPGQPQVPEAILIITPGNGSVALPMLRVSGEADPTFEQNLVVQISDATGTILATQPTTIQGGGAVRGPFDVLVPFTVSAQQPGRISVFATSARDGGLIHLASVEVTLLTGGTAAPFAGPVHNETHILLEPRPQANISGGTLHVSGFSDYVFESQLSLALCGEGGSGAPDKVCGAAGNVLATGSAKVNAADVGQPGPFAGDLAYHVSATVHARLAVYSRSARDGGILHLASVPVLLAP